MGWMGWTGFLILAAFLWWAGFYATAQMRIKKNAAREILAKKLLAEKAAKDAELAQQQASKE